MPRRSFRDPTTGVLKAHGYVETNEPGDVAQIEADDFDLEPGRWRWDGTQWQPVPPPPPQPSPAEVRRQAIQQLQQMIAALPAGPVKTVLDTIAQLL